MLLLIATVVTSLTEPAVVELPPHPIRIDEVRDGRIESVDVVYRRGREYVRTTLTIVLATDRAAMTELEVPIELPHDCSVVGLTLAIGDDIPLVGKIEGADAARGEYEGIVRRMMDPALLEWSHETRTHDRLQLRVFPVRAGRAATVTLEIISTRITPIELATELVVVQQRSSKTAVPAPSTAGRSVSRRLSLVATEPN